jgi:hypothetical protein
MRGRTENMANQSGEEPSEGDVEKLQMEMVTILLTSSMDFIRNTTQILQALTGLLLTSYVTLFAGLLSTASSSALPLPQPIYFLPILFFVVSLAFSFISAAFYSGYHIVVGDLDSVLEGYDTAIKARRKQLIWPSVFAILGIGTFGFLAYYGI